MVSNRRRLYMYYTVLIFIYIFFNLLLYYSCFGRLWLFQKNKPLFTTIHSEDLHKSDNEVKLRPSKLKLIRENSVKKQRLSIQKEMIEYEFQNETLNDFIPEKGGKPLRNVIVTTWRSGSTFLGGAVAVHPGTFYHYEPLEHFGIQQIRPESKNLAGEALRVINDLLNCDFTNQNEMIEHSKNHSWVFSVNQRVWRFCEIETVCQDGEFMSKMCRLFPFQILKTVRLRLELAAALLKHDDFDVRLIYLVRDPRGTMQSRNHRDWCPQHPDCYDPGMLCLDLEDDFAQAEILIKKYPNRFMAMRYEDIALNLQEEVEKVYKFFRLQFHQNIVDYLESHTKISRGGVNSIFRDSKSIPFRWRVEYIGNFSKVVEIQEKCRKAMTLWGYNLVQQEEQLLSFNPLSDHLLVQ